MNEIKLTKENVLAAAETCPAAKEALMKLVPEAFGEEWENITEDLILQPALSARMRKPLEEKGYFLQVWHGNERIGIISGGLLKIDDPVNVKVEYRNDATVILKRTNQ